MLSPENQEEDKIIVREVEILKGKMPQRDVPWVMPEPSDGNVSL